jgi:DNA repair protein SbcC/Rad50
MRLHSIELSGFRGFSQRQTFDLDADAIVVVGANGHGKTSLFDGILWALTGRIPRLQGEDAQLVSLYSDSGEARVMLQLSSSAIAGGVTITRTFDGEEARLQLQTSERTFSGTVAEGKLIDLIWPEAAAASNSSDSLASVLTRCNYLQQDSIRHFVEAGSNNDRFNAVSELIGAGRVTELQMNLERAKKAWTTVTNQRQEELKGLRERLASIEGRLAESTSRPQGFGTPITTDEWNLWWQEAVSLGLRAINVAPASRDAPAAIDRAIKELDSVGHANARRMQVAVSTIDEIAKLDILVKPEPELLREKLLATQKDLDGVKQKVSEEQSRLAELRRSQAELKEKAEQLRTLALLALDHLHERCPVCDQTYNFEATKRRLENLAKNDLTVSLSPVPPAELSEALRALAEKEKELSLNNAALRAAENELREWSISRASIDKRLDDLGILVGTGGEPTLLLQEMIAECESIATKVNELKGAGEMLALRLGQSSAIASNNELRHEAALLRAEVAEREKAVFTRVQSGDLAQRTIEALREATSSVVQERLKEISPLLQSIWARIDPHPAFRVVNFFSEIIRGKGQLSTSVSDLIAEKQCNRPSLVLSSSQMNALAVSVFLALNLGMPKLPLSVALLDDPLQSLDDINLLGLVDLFRRTKNNRQLLVSTHDKRFGDLLSRKLRPTGHDSRTVVIEFEGWRREGPSVTLREIKSDPVPLRLVS